jgi:hypothetical protein
MRLLRNSLLVGIAISGLGSNAIAHNVKASGNIAANFHIEPRHNPKAGEPSLAWFALTKEGGELVPLERCDCQLTVYNSRNQAVLQPSLNAIAAEQYQGIPGAEIVFPEGGIYKLELSGKPKQADAFTPFKLAYNVTVQAGAPTPIVGQVVVEEIRPEFPIAAIAGTAGAIAGVTGIVWFVKRTRRKSSNLDNRGK